MLGAGESVVEELLTILLAESEGALEKVGMLEASSNGVVGV